VEVTLTPRCLFIFKEDVMLEKYFKLKENKTNVKTEVLAGVTTFMTMAYILAVNPNILSATGMDSKGVFMATAIASLIGTLLMALLANHPFALAPGMGLNAYFAYTVVLGSGYSWQQALAAVFIEGIIFVILSLTNVREAIFNSIPKTLKYAVSCGIGLFIAFIGLQNAKIVVGSATLVTFNPLNTEGFNNGRNEILGVVLALVGIIIMAILLIKKVRGGILIGILATWVLGIICELVGLYKVGVLRDLEGNVIEEWFSMLPNFTDNFKNMGALGDVAFKMDFNFFADGLKGIGNFLVIVFAFLFVDIFDTLGTLMGVAAKADMLDKEGKLPRIKGALLSDAIATSAGALLGTSTTTTYVESATGVSEGGRTGLTSITTAILFAVAILLSPIFLAIPSFATAPALIIVGFYMMGTILKIDFDDMAEAIPAFIAIIAMPFTYSISEGICFGIISYVVINLVTGKAKAKKISILMYILAVVFIIKYILV